MIISACIIYLSEDPGNARNWGEGKMEKGHCEIVDKRSDWLVAAEVGRAVLTGPAHLLAPSIPTLSSMLPFLMLGFSDTEAKKTRSPGPLETSRET